MSVQPGDDTFAQRLVEALDQHAERPKSDLPGDTDPATDAVLAQLRATATWSGPPAELRERLLATVTAESTAESTTVSTAEPTTESTAESTDNVVPLSTRRRRRFWAIPAAAAAAVAFTFGVLAVDDYVNRPEPGTTYVAAGTALAPEAEAKVTVAAAPAGFSVVIAAQDLPAAAPGSYYAAFLRGPDGVIPLGSFHARQSGRPITLWSGVDPRDYPTFIVTLQREGGPPEPSDQVVLTGMLSG